MMSKSKLGHVLVCLGISFALGAAGSGCGPHHATTNPPTGPTPPSSGGSTPPSTGSSGGSNGSTPAPGMLFTPAQFAAALSAYGAPPASAGYNPNFPSIFSFAGATVAKNPDLKGPNNVVIYNGPNGGITIATQGSYTDVDLSVFTGMTAQQAVAAYVQVYQNERQVLTLPNGKTLNMGLSAPASGGGSGGGGGTPCGCNAQGVCAECIIARPIAYNGSNNSNGESSGGYSLPYVPGVINVVQLYGGTINGTQLYQDEGGNLYNQSNGTKDVDLQRAEIQDQAAEDRAQAMATHFEMNIESARQLSQLADRLNSMTTNQGTLSDEDRAAMSDAAFAVAHISSDDVNAAATKFIQTGDKTAINDLMEKAATNLGMSSSAGLRDQILPALGINL